MSEESKVASIGGDAEFDNLLMQFWTDAYNSSIHTALSENKGPLVAYIESWADSRPRQGDQVARSLFESVSDRADRYMRALEQIAVGDAEDPRKHADAALVASSQWMEADSRNPLAPSDTQAAVELPEERCLHWDGAYGYEADQMLEFGAQQREAALEEAALVCDENAAHNRDTQRCADAIRTLKTNGGAQ